MTDISIIAGSRDETQTPDVGLVAAIDSACSEVAIDTTVNRVRELLPVLKLLSDETRMRILLYLTRDGELNVGQLCVFLKQCQPAVSHHLAMLRIAKLIEPRREGKFTYYHVVPQRIQAVLQTLCADFSSDPIA